MPFLHFTVSYVSWICIFKHMNLAEGWGGVRVGIQESLCAEDFLLHTWVCCTLPESAVLGATVKIMLTPMSGNMAKYDPNDKILKKLCFMSSMFQDHQWSTPIWREVCHKRKQVALFPSFIAKRQPGQKNVMLALFIAWFPFSDMHYNAQQHTVAQFTPTTCECWWHHRATKTLCGGRAAF